jgi:hypothetical protein
MTAAWRRRVGPVRPAPRAALARRAFTELPTGHLDDWNAAHTAACRQREHLHRQAERAWWSRRA